MDRLSSPIVYRWIERKGRARGVLVGTTLNVHLDGFVVAEDAATFSYNITGRVRTQCNGLLGFQWRRHAFSLGTPCNGYSTFTLANQTISGFDFTGTFSVTNPDGLRRWRTMRFFKHQQIFLEPAF